MPALRVHVRLSGPLAQRLGARRAIDLEPGATVDDLVAALARDAGFDAARCAAWRWSPRAASSLAPARCATARSYDVRGARRGRLIGPRDGAAPLAGRRGVGAGGGGRPP